MTRYVLHYAPDNASLIIRLVLEELGVGYDTRLVDRTVRAQDSADYKTLNPVGRIPALETAHGPMFETGAIALWLADTHADRVELAPRLTAPRRARFLSWLFFLSNTLHAELRTLFYPGNIAGPDPTAQRHVSKRTQSNLVGHFALLETEARRGEVLGAEALTVCDLYSAALLRWPAIYPTDADRAWFDLGRWPALLSLAHRVERRPSAAAVATAEGLGPTPFSNPRLPTPPEGSAT